MNIDPVIVFLIGEVVFVAFITAFAFYDTGKSSKKIQIIISQL